MESQLRFAWGMDETIAALLDLLALAERGEMTGGALRFYKSDGTWEDIALGDSEEERHLALAELQRRLRQAH